jgi:hypothetical protein
VRPEPLQLPAVLPVGSLAFGGFHLDQVLFDRLIDPQANLRLLRFRGGLYLAGEDGALCPPGFEGLSRSRPDRPLLASSLAFEFELQRFRFCSLQKRRRQGSFFSRK